MATFLLPRRDFLFRGGEVKKTPLTEADRILRRTVKSWLNLPQRASPEVVFIHPSWGGYGLPPLADLADVTTVAHAFWILNADDPERRCCRTRCEVSAGRGRALKIR